VQCSNEITITIMYTFIRPRTEYSKDPNKNRQADRQTDRQADRQTLQLIPQQHSNAHNKKNKYEIYKNHIVLVLKCSYTTRVNSLKFMHVTDTP